MVLIELKLLLVKGDTTQLEIVEGVEEVDGGGTQKKNSSKRLHGPPQGLYLWCVPSIS